MPRLSDRVCSCVPTRGARCCLLGVQHGLLIPRRLTAWMWHLLLNRKPVSPTSARPGQAHTRRIRWPSACTTVTSASLRPLSESGQRRSVAFSAVRTHGGTGSPTILPSISLTQAAQRRIGNGQIYRFSLGTDGTAHFSGIDGVGDGERNLTDYARQGLELVGD